MTPGEEQDLRRAHARAVMAMDASGREVATLRALVERHEAAARVHTEERAAMHGELARVTGEVERLRAALAVAQTSLEAATSGRRLTVVDEIERLQRERDEARAIIEGRTVAPTDAEIIAHHAAMGWWTHGGLPVALFFRDGVIHLIDDDPADILSGDAARGWIADRSAWPHSTWRALDRTGRPCAWPVVASEPARTSQAYLRLWPAASQIVADEGLLRDDVTAALGRASMDGRTRVEMTSGRNPKRTVVFVCVSRGSDDVFVWTATVEGGQ